MIEVMDALGRTIRLPAPPARIVSLVPSETDSVCALGALDRLVGRTEYCVEPRGRIERVPIVGGTKKHDTERVIALAPDLVLANREENGRRDVERLIDAGLAVHVSFPCSVRESAGYLRSLAQMLGVEGPVAHEERAPEGRVRVFVPIWRDPWMSFDARTYASDVLAHAGAINVFADRARRFPLAADIDDMEPIDAGERDTRYPRTSMEEIAARAPDLVLLPDEPYEFDESHVREIEGWGIGARVELVSGKDLFWYGARTHAALEHLRAIVGR
jgi:ABC-type Fe3+-hydroxamate transport system substrate-binding protein